MREAAAIVGEDELLSRQRLQRRAQLRVRTKAQCLDIVDLCVIGIGVDAVMLHQSSQRDAVLAQVLLLERKGFVAGKAQMALNKAADPLLYVLRSRRIDAIKRVV